MTSDRRITWSLATLFRNDSYNSTFTFEVIQPAFDLICQYFQLSMLRAGPPAEIFATTFGVQSVTESQDDDMPHGEANSFMSRFMDLVRPTYAMKENV
jgi:hypothetical protein